MCWKHNKFLVLLNSTAKLKSCHRSQQHIIQYMKEFYSTNINLSSISCNDAEHTTHAQDKHQHHNSNYKSRVHLYKATYLMQFTLTFFSASSENKMRYKLYILYWKKSQKKDKFLNCTVFTEKMVFNVEKEHLLHISNITWQWMIFDLQQCTHWKTSSEWIQRQL